MMRLYGLTKQAYERMIFMNHLNKLTLHTFVPNQFSACTYAVVYSYVGIEIHIYNLTHLHLYIYVHMYTTYTYI